MGVLDQVTQLQSQGMSEQDIVNNLQQQGISPKEITDAVNQAKIKSAVTAGGEAVPSPETAEPVASAAATGEGGYYSPQTQEMGAGSTPQAGMVSQPAEYYEEGAYGAAPSTGIDSDTIIEIANQVFGEKIKKVEKQVGEINEFKTLTQTKVDNIDERLKRIEKMIDILQIKILEKVGAYGRELETTKKEVAMVEDTLGKVIKGKVSHKKISKKKSSKKKKR